MEPRPYAEALYASLRDEFRAYIDKMTDLWHKKLLLVGGVILFVLGKDALGVGWSTMLDTPERFPAVLAWATLALPLVGLLLDLKNLEYSAHARAISDFIRTNYPDLPRDWERANWGDGPASAPRSRLMPWLRTWATVATSGGPTLVLFWLACLVLGWRFQAPAVAAGAAVLVTAAGVAGAYLGWRLLWPTGLSMWWPDGFRLVFRGATGDELRAATPPATPCTPSDGSSR